MQIGLQRECWVGNERYYCFVITTNRLHADSAVQSRPIFACQPAVSALNFIADTSTYNAVFSQVTQAKHE